MLENKEAVFKEDKIIAFRINTGDEIIGKITSFDSQSVTVKKPCTLTFANRPCSNFHGHAPPFNGLCPTI